MSTIQQDMTDTAVQMEHVAKRLANVLGSGSEEAWDQATQIHAAATIIRAWVDKHKAKVRAAVDEDAPPCKYNKEAAGNAYYNQQHPFGVCRRGVDVGPCDTEQRERSNCPLYAPIRAAVDRDAPTKLPELHTFEEQPPCKFYYNDVCNLGMTTGECGLSLATQKHCWGYQS